MKLQSTITKGSDFFGSGMGSHLLIKSMKSDSFNRAVLWQK